MINGLLGMFFASNFDRVNPIVWPMFFAVILFVSGLIFYSNFLFKIFFLIIATHVLYFILYNNLD